MLRAARARRIATATAFGGGGLTLLGASTVALLYLQAKLAWRAVGFTEWSSPEVAGLHGSGDGPPLSLAMMGDSTAAGFAVLEADQTPGSLLASGLSAAANRPVHLTNVAVVGAVSKDLLRQLEQLRACPPDVAVIFIGANDVIHRVRPADSVRQLQYVVRELSALGTQTVVGTCPDLGTVQPISQPLRHIARRASRQLAAAQTIGVVEEGGRSVSLSDLLAAEFRAAPDAMFGPDGFHPSARGYAQAAAAVLPSVCAALGLLTEPYEQPETGEGALPVEVAAVEAAERPGTEVSPTTVEGRERGRRSRWAVGLRRRLRRRTDDGTTPGTADSTEAETTGAHRGDGTVSGPPGQDEWTMTR
ncbi:SGNH/GDSL hydrolase family protein [Salinactinospora qingdaonensis]|uniref:SGNH/GDSL hydrolase family protein n=1 Tax=Salinactinospora qingdaonensis TaxID=702744 RepID=UPI0031E8E2C3